MPKSSMPKTTINGFSGSTKIIVLSPKNSVHFQETLHQSSSRFPGPETQHFYKKILRRNLILVLIFEPKVGL